MQQRIILLVLMVCLFVIAVVVAVPRGTRVAGPASLTISKGQPLAESDAGSQRVAAPIKKGEGQPMQDYGAGYRLGECLAAGGCRVFVGTIRSVGAAEKEANVDAQRAVVYRTLDIVVDEWLLSSGADEVAEIKLASAARPAFTKTALGPWTAWQIAELTPSGKLLVALWGEKAQREVWGDQPEAVALAASDSQTLAGLKNIVELHKQYESSPQEFVNISQRLETNYDSMLTGYVMAYVKRKEEISNVDDAAVVLSKLLKNKQIPDYVQTDISYQLLGNFYRLSENSREKATESLVSAGTSDNAGVAEPAVDVLIRLSKNKDFNMRPFLTPERKRKLIERYQARVAKGAGSPQKYPEFETQLGINMPN
jgi:hypothetical protein